MHIERCTDLTLQLGECPVWDVEQQRLWAMDCRRGHLLAIDVSSQSYERHLLPAPCGSFALNADGRVVVALKEAVALYDPVTRSLQTLAELDLHLANLRFNDGTALPDGRFLSATMHIGLQPQEAPQGGIYVLDRQAKLQRIGPALRTANGPLIHPKTGRLFICDSAAQTIYYFDISSGQARDRKTFASTESLQSAPDGCCFDADGGLWTALVRTGELARFDEQGLLTERIALPLAHPSALCFGGPDLADLYVTSIADSGRLSASGPLDGAILRISHLGYRGQPKARAAIAPV